MRHPFASVQYFQSSLSSESLDSPPEQEQLDEQEPIRVTKPIASPLPLPQHPSVSSPSLDNPLFARPRSALARVSSRIPLPRRKPVAVFLDTQIASIQDASQVQAPSWSGKASPGHFVKHSSKVTLLLSGQEENASEPVYSNGDTVVGILAIPRPTGLLSLEVKIEARIKLKEAAGGGAFDTDIINETLYIWDSRQDEPFPSKVNFHYTLPSHFTNTVTGERSRLPPTFQAYLPGIPGFNVNVSYGIFVYITRIRDRSDWWRKGRRLRVPFRYVQLTRPDRPGPFPLLAVRNEHNPKTLFEFSLRSRRPDRNNVEVHLFLPGSRVCSIKEPIQFFVTLFGDEDSLAPFNAYQPSPVSFLPISQGQSLASSIQSRLAARAQSNSLPSPIIIQLSRRTAVDARAAGMSISEEKSHMAFTKPVGYGVIHTTNRGPNSVTFSGTFTIPPSIVNAGFATSGVQVTDAIVLSIVPPETARARFLPFSESVPIRLTTESHDCPSATVTVSDWE